MAWQKTAAKAVALRTGQALVRGAARRVAERQRTERRRKAIVYGSVAGVALAAGGFIAWRIVRARHQPVSLTGTVTVAAPRPEAYSFWRNFENFPNFMRHVEDVRVLSDRRSHWVLRAAGGAHAEWDAEITEERPNERIAWQSEGGTPITALGEVNFADAPGGGTEIRVTLLYSPTEGVRGTVARLLRRGLQAEMRADLGRFRQLIETGAVAADEGPPAGSRRWFQRKVVRGLEQAADRIEGGAMAAAQGDGH